MPTTRQPRVILITGANKGIGFEVVKKLIQDPLAIKDVILLGSRDSKRGQEALIKLGSPSNVHLLPIDTTSRASILRAAEEIKLKYGGHLDIIVNNAGVGHADIKGDAARQVFATNYFAIKMVNDHLIPFLRENGRVVNVSSAVGAWTLHELPTDLREKYLSPTLTEEQLDHLVDDFISAINTKSLDKTGYDAHSPFTVYNVSKLALNALTQVHAREWSRKKAIIIVAVCPGFCDTDMTHHAPGSRSPELGANSILYVINTPRAELENGGFYQDGIQKPLHYAADNVVNGSTSSVEQEEKT